MHWVFQARLTLNEVNTIFDVFNFVFTSPRFAKLDFTRKPQDGLGRGDNLVERVRGRFLQREEPLRKVSAVRVKAGCIKAAPTAPKQKRTRIEEPPATY